MCIHTCILHFVDALSDYRDDATVNKVRHHFDKVLPLPSALYPEVGKLDCTNLRISHSVTVVMIYILSTCDYIAFSPQGSVLNWCYSLLLWEYFAKEES